VKEVGVAAGRGEEKWGGIVLVVVVEEEEEEAEEEEGVEVEVSV
jgi:hypothetical protein